jgi:VanZ family protein
MPGPGFVLFNELTRTSLRVQRSQTFGKCGCWMIKTAPASFAAPVIIRNLGSRNLARAQSRGVRGVVKSFTIDNVTPVHAIQISFRILTWSCVILLAVLSLLPAQDIMRTGIPGQLEHFVAYAGSASIATVGYRQRGAVRIVGLFWIYAGILEYLQQFSPGRHPSIADFAASALGALFGGLAVALLLRRLWKGAYSDVV